ncbi:sequence-specific DNA binding transcription factor [Raphanus sativus]|nr:sequence-specific DNA binding transcription factor [Raphanus sativus]
MLFYIFTANPEREELPPFKALLKRSSSRSKTLTQILKYNGECDRSKQTVRKLTWTDKGRSHRSRNAPRHAAGHRGFLHKQREKLSGEDEASSKLLTDAICGCGCVEGVMDGKLTQGGGASSFGGFDMRVHHPDSMNQQHLQGLPFTMVTGQTCDHHHKGERESDDDEEPSFNEESGGDGHNNKSAKGSPWQRVKWTDKMVKLLITAVSYIGDDSCMDGGSRRKFAALQKKGKWKSVSKVMSERGYHVSPQQCEDKFNDLNKRYKKLNDMLGRGTSCQVVENPKLLDSIGFLNDKEKDDVRKIMSSKQLFYEEMCSYHNGNRLHLPHDLALQRSLQLALRSRDDHENHQVEDIDDEDHDEHDDDVDRGDCRVVHYGGGGGGPLKKGRQSHSHEDGDHQGHVNSLECSKVTLAHQMPFPQGVAESVRSASVQKQWIESRTLELEEQKLQIQVELLELEKQRFRWERFSKKRDQELERMRMENERMKLENDRMGLELKQRELGVEL